MDVAIAKSLVSSNAEARQLLTEKDTCDKFDYLAAVGCGVIGGLVDIFLVGAPGDSVLGAWTDAQVDNAVMSFAKITGWSPKAGKEGSVASAIGHLERKFRVNYDQRHTADVYGTFNMSTKNHHLKSLAHSPDIIGLFFSLLNQFTSTSSFIASGQIITIRTDTFELQGGNFIAKLFCGTANWFAHIMSDIAGSSGARGGAGRGSGIAAPFYELFQFCRFGQFQNGDSRQDLATIATKAFEAGYDIRFSLAAAIPVLLTDLSIRLIWSLRRYFALQKPLKECIPTQRHDSLRVMLLWGNGTLCAIDGLDAAIRSGGNFFLFFTRLNLVAWTRFVLSVLKEIIILVQQNDPLQQMIRAFERINAALQDYLHELEQIDIALFEKETQEYKQLLQGFEGISSDSEFCAFLSETYQKMGIKESWSGDFDTFMSDKNNRLVFS